MTRFVSRTTFERLEREWRMIDPERPKIVYMATEDEPGVNVRRLRMGRFDEAEFVRD